MSTTKVDVLVVGAGPAGLFCANALATAGVNVKIVEIKSEMINAGHADGFMPRTIEILQSYGLAKSVLEKGSQIHSVAFYDHVDGKGIKCTDHKPPVMEETARYPFLTTLRQAGIEQILIDSMALAGVTVQRSTKPSSISISEEELSNGQAYPVKVSLSLLDASGNEVGVEKVEAKYVVGTDGAHSWVRKAVGLQMLGETTDHAWGAIDFSPSLASTFPDWRNCSTVNAKDHSFLLIPREKGLVRVYLDLGSETELIDKTTGRVNPGKVTKEKLLDIIKKQFEPFVFESSVDGVDWWTLYIVGQRVASTLSVQDRVFIAGDAAHTHSPKAGQGMNVSMSDTHNLAWKLIYALRGWGKPELLKTYNFERLKVAQELIAFDKWYSQGFSMKARQELFGDSHAPPPFQAFLEMSGLTSGIGIQYSPSVLTASSEGASTLAIGKRLPPHQILRLADQNPVEIQDLCPADGRFKIFVFPQENTEHLAPLAVTLSQIIDRYPSGIFDIMTVLKGNKDVVTYLEVPVSLRSSWQKVFIDDVHRQHVSHKFAGRIYEAYGISPDGALVVVRPDGYVGATFALSEVSSALQDYLSAFLAPL